MKTSKSLRFFLEPRSVQVRPKVSALELFSTFEMTSGGRLLEEIKGSRDSRECDKHDGHAIFTSFEDFFPCDFDRWNRRSKSRMNVILRKIRNVERISVRCLWAILNFLAAFLSDRRRALVGVPCSICLVNVGSRFVCSW